MAVPALLAIGADRAWRARMQRVFGLRAELRWLGAYASGDPRRCATQPVALLLLDGDDPLTNRSRRRPNLPAPRRLYFYRQPDLAALERCVASGALGCLDKQAEVEALLRAVSAATSGLFVTAPRLVEALVQAVHGDARAYEGPPAAAAPLTGRQREVVARVASGLSNKEIARALAISPETVKAHLHAAFEREGVHGRTALLAALARQQARG